MPPSGRPPPFRVGCALDHIPPRASPVNVWFTGWREPISISGDGKVAWRDTAPAALFFDKAGFFESLAGVCAGDHAAQEYQRVRTGAAAWSTSTMRCKRRNSARGLKKRSRCRMHRDRENRHRAGPPQLYLTRPGRPLQQRSIADRNPAKPPAKRGEHAAANDVAAVVVVVGSTVHVIVIRIAVIIRPI